MTVSTVSNKIIYLGNASNTTFPFSFPGVAAADIEVIFTDALGNMTTLSTSLYSLALNAPQGANPTGVGGVVTYPLVGSPIANGTSLTIARLLPVTQATSLANQSTFYQTAIEQALDYLTMVDQQLNENFLRVLQAPIVDPSTVTLVLPAAANRAGLILGFDSSGNVIATSVIPAGTVSSAMQPVVNAATLALGRAAFGLGSMAVEGIGAGLQDDGAGNARVTFVPVQDSTNQAVLAAFHLNVRLATGALTYTLPRANTLFSSFGFWVYALTAPVSFAIDSHDSFTGGVGGASLTIPPGIAAFIETDGAASGAWFIRQTRDVSLNAPLNLQLNATVAASALTIAIKDRNGNDPSTASPIILAFRDPTLTAGDPIARVITAANSIVVPNGATLGTTNGVPFRIWGVAFDNAGTVVLGVILCTSPGTNVGLDESSTPSPTGISAGATLGQTFYAASGLATKAFRILGYVDFNAGQATAGAWATPPSVVQLFGPGINKPGAVLQSPYTQSSAIQSTTNNYTIGNTLPAPANGGAFLTRAITPYSAVNILRVTTKLNISAGASSRVLAYLYDGTNTVAVSASNQPGSQLCAIPLRYQKVAGSVAPITYTLYGSSNASTTHINSDDGTNTWGGAFDTFIQAEEIMA